MVEIVSPARGRSCAAMLGAWRRRWYGLQRVRLGDRTRLSTSLSHFRSLDAFVKVAASQAGPNPSCHPSRCLSKESPPCPPHRSRTPPARHSLCPNRTRPILCHGFDVVWISFATGQTPVIPGTARKSESITLSTDHSICRCSDTNRRAPQAPSMKSIKGRKKGHVPHSVSGHPFLPQPRGKRR